MFNKFQEIANRISVYCSNTQHMISRAKLEKMYPHNPEEVKVVLEVLLINDILVRDDAEIERYEMKREYTSGKEKHKELIELFQE